MKLIISLTVFCILFFFSCTNKNEDLLVEGLKPVYIEKSTIKNIYTTAPQPLKEPGKIYIYGHLVFVNEKGRGIHIIDNSNPYNPTKLKFINIPGNYDLAIKNNFMYVDNASDLVTLNINDLDNITVENRIENVYHVYQQFYPEFHVGYFECVDTTKGFVIAWQKADLTNPKCHR